MSPTGRTAALFAVCGLVALATPPIVPLLGVLAVLAACAVDGLLLRRPPEVRREAPELLSRGVPEPLTLTPAGGRGERLTLRQATPPDVFLERHLGAGSLRTQVVAARRGRHELPPAAARLRGPLGLVSRTAAVTPPADVLVYPDLPAARRVAVAARYSRFRSEGTRGRGPLGLGTEFEQVRDYLPDDDIRQVNWRATARLGRPMSNEYRLEEDRDVICVVDAGRLMGAPVGEVTRLDAALDAVCAVAAVADELRDRVGTVAFDDEVRRRLSPARQGGRLVVRELFDLEPSPVQSDFRRAFHAVEGEKRAFVLLFTDLLDETATRPLLEAIPILARKHAVAVVTVADPEVGRPLREAPEDLGGVARQAVALQVATSRRRAGATIAAAGASIVEAPADKLGAACVREYLRAKARARL
jgi:uncharacterized protein (DUF58 family)